MTAPFSLDWLPAPPTDFRNLCRKLDNEDAPGLQVQQLAGFALDGPQSTSLSRAIARLQGAARSLAPLTSFRLGFLSSATDDLLTEALPAAAARYGVALSLTKGPFDQILQQVFDPASEINDAELDAVMVLVDQRWLGLTAPHAAVQGEAAVEDAACRISDVADAITAQGRSVIVTTVAPMPQRLLGSIERMLPGSPTWCVARYNEALIVLCRERGYYLLDIEGLANRYGLEAWFDPVHWNSYKLPFNPDADVLVADLLGRLLGAIRGRSRKCLVLDLDNTLWGGVIGDDGLEGIVLGQGSAKGEAFLAVQRMAMNLRSRGIMLAVSSKNDEANAREPFQKHTEMLLREEHISVFQANWTDKASNLEAIARALNIGLDALVFLDDNPAERGQVRAALPMVAVPELPSDPSQYARILGAAGYFEAVTFSEEDAIRAGAYAADIKRAEVMRTVRNVGDYLSGLSMELAVAPFDANGRGRITQLINKSNQFNLTTRRRTEAEVAMLETSPDSVALQARLSDRFGDMGMISVVIAKDLGDGAWDLDSWLMSCRVLGRKVEDAMLSTIAEQVKCRGGRKLIGRYIPTAKNGMVADHYAKLGFSPEGEGADGAQVYGLDLDTYRASELPMKLNLEKLDRSAIDKASAVS